MKKLEVRSLLALLLAMMMVLALVACGNADDTLPPESGDTDPAVTEPTETDPIETEPAETDPVETDPPATEPAETDPPATEPVETDPPATEPVETKPAETEPDETECAHKYGSGKTVIPTCKTEGYTEYTCTKCGEVKTENTKPKVDHLYVNTVISYVSCTVDGETADVCSYCGDTKNKQVTPAYGHFGTAKIVDAQSFTHHKMELMSCSSCGLVYSAKGVMGEEHDFTLIEKVADQTTEGGYIEYGYEVYECDCGYVLKISSNHADGHYYEVDAATGKYACKCGNILTGELKDVHNGNLEAGPVVFAD